MSSAPLEIEARQLSLPNHLHTFSPQISCLLYDPISSALALRHSDSSFSLYPSFTPLSLSSFPRPGSLVPSPTSAAAFLHLRTAANPTTTTVFVTSSPLLRPSPSTLIRFHVLRGGRFVGARVVSSHRDLEFDGTKSGVVFKVSHGVSVKLSGGINVFSLYSVSNSKIWVFAVRSVGDDLKLMKCAVIDCCFPVFAIRVLFGFLTLGEENGVRFFPLRRLLKGNHKLEKKINGKKINSRRGSTNAIDLAMAEKKSDSSEKLRCAKIRQDSKDVGAFFVTFDKNADNSTNGKLVKTISIQALSPSCFVVLDSDGDVHHLCISHSVQGLETSCTVRRLTRTMKAAEIAVFHDVSAVMQFIWMSDGCHTVHVTAVSEADVSSDKIDNKETNENLLQTSVKQTIFTSEKIQDVVPLAANSVLILGQGNLFAYAIL
ncbi:uncharacterized protein LOC127258169 [Andrographis paniculata]|uniref:uncharacterized protein LOC127258169 n=1 Tax=Andrographis paniculata TaxID=175694 RepID=UPI0021E90FA1|nr:uncharacterized protein LOC127258169 [Andrographis paniculata]